VHDPDHPRWLQALCKPCHDRKTSTLDAGFGRDAVDRGLQPYDPDALTSCPACGGSVGLDIHTMECPTGADEIERLTHRHGE
jgi:hypothetical protein